MIPIMDEEHIHHWVRSDGTGKPYVCQCGATRAMFDPSPRQQSHAGSKRFSASEARSTMRTLLITGLIAIVAGSAIAGMAWPRLTTTTDYFTGPKVEHHGSLIIAALGLLVAGIGGSSQSRV